MSFQFCLTNYHNSSDNGVGLCETFMIAAGALEEVGRVPAKANPRWQWLPQAPVKPSLDLDPDWGHTRLLDIPRIT